jgi:hypothetical protein
VLLCPLAVLLTYNAVALPFRSAGVARGYALADQPADLVRSLRLAEWREFLERASAFGYGALATLTVFAIASSAKRWGAAPLGSAVVLAPFLLGAAVSLLGLRRWPRRGIETTLAALGLAALLATRLG